MPQTCSRAAAPGGVAWPRRWRVAILLGLALSLGGVTGSQAATTWTVCASGCDFTNIKAAIAAPTTVDGDTLAIAAGTYTEAGILVDKSLTLQGEAAETTIVQAAEAPNTATDRVFTIPSGVTVTLQNLQIRYGHRSEDFGRGGGIYSEGALTLVKSIVRGNSYGGYVGSGGGWACPRTGRRSGRSAPGWGRRSHTPLVGQRRRGGAGGGRPA